MNGPGPQTQATDSRPQHWPPAIGGGRPGFGTGQGFPVPTTLPSVRANDVTVSRGLIAPIGQIVRGPVRTHDLGSRRESTVMTTTRRRPTCRRMRTIQSPNASMPPLTVARYVHELEINGVAGWDARHASGCPPRAAGVPTATTKPATTAIVGQIVPERRAMCTRTDHRARATLGARAS